MSEQTSNPTSGQNVPKSKFRRKSRQEQPAASKLRMERRGEKLDAAREKLAKQKPPKKPGAVKRLAHTAGHGVHGFVHGKLYEVEHENVGTEGAHRSELAAESVYRFGRRKLRKAIREHPAKAVERAESKHIKATADYYYRKTVEEHPEMQEGGAVSRYLQKQKIKRQYAKQAREAARQTAKAAEGTASVTGKLTGKVSAYIKEHPGGLLLMLAAFLLLVVLQSCMSSLVTVGNGVAGAIGASTYAAEDADLLGAEAAPLSQLRQTLEAVLRLPFAHYLSSHAPHPLPKAQVAVHLHHLDRLRLEDPSRPGPYAPRVCRSQYREQGRRSVLLIDRGLAEEGESLP